MEAQALTSLELDGNLRTQCLHLLYKVCKTCELLPASYLLREELISIGNIHCYGGFADISEGKYLGHRVAIKHLRFGAKDAFNKIFKVPKFEPARQPIVAQLSHSGSVGKL